MITSFFVLGGYDWGDLYSRLIISCPRIMEINTEFMTDAFLRALQPCPQLSSIVLYVTEELTNDAIESLAVDCPSLTILSLRASTASPW